MNTVICPFSGDPITYGHIDIIERAAHTFEHVIAAIGVNPLKQYLFTLEERLQMAREALGYLKNVEVDSYEGLLADFARNKHTNAVIRGIRNAEDFNYEWMLHQINIGIDNTLETFWIPCSKEKENISSTEVRKLWQQGGNISALAPAIVIEMLNNKIFH
jgi:pantetheine-phosphate adenylyltransferase